MRTVAFLSLLLVAACSGDDSSPAPGPSQAKQASAPAGEAGGLAQLVPADADVVIRLASLDAATSLLEEFAAAMDKPLPPNPMAMLGAQMGIDLSQVEPTRPVAIAVAFDPKRPMPATTCILPARNADALVASAQGKQTARAEGYVAVCDAAAFEPGGSRLVESMPEGEVAMRIDLERMVAKYRKEIDQALGMARMLKGQASQAPGPVPAAAFVGMFDSVLATVKDVVDSGETLDLVVRREAAQLRFEVAYTARAGSALAQPAEASGLAALATALPRDYPATVMFQLDVGAWVDAFRSLAELAPEASRAEATKRLDALANRVAALDDIWMVACDLSGGRLQLVAACRAEDAPAFVKDYVALATEPLPGSGVVVKREGTRDVGGVSVHRLSVEVDPAVQKNPERTAKTLEALFGGDSFPVEAAAKGDTVVCSVGAPMDAVLEAGAAPAGLASAIGEAGGDLRFCLRLELRALIRGAAALTRAIDPDMKAPNLPEGAPVLITVTGARSGRVHRMGLSLDLKRTKELVQASAASSD